MEFESLFRKVVQEEMEQAKESAIVSLQEKMEQAKERVIVSVLKVLELVNPRTSPNHHVEKKQGIGYQLRFANKLPPTIYTNTKIESEMGEPIKVELVDTSSKEIVTSSPLSSMKIQTVVLDGNLGFEDQEYWTEQEFNAKVLKQRKDRRPLVIGDLKIALKDGVGIISDLSFTDNSKQTNSGTFRLGARVVQSNDDQVRIKEATSEAFRVKEYRAKVYQKHYPPSLDDDVWRLVHISKDGKYHMRLADQHIHKVKDLMHMYKDNPSKLINILQCSCRLLEQIAQHASTCDEYDDKPNAIDGQNYQPPAKRCHIQKPLVGSRKEQSYENVNNFVPVDGSSNFCESNPLTSLQAEPISNATTELHMGVYHASTLSSYIDGFEDHNHLLQLPEAQDTHPIQWFAPQGSEITHWHSFSTSTSNSDWGGLEDHNQQLQFAIPQNNHPTSISYLSAIVNSGMDGSAATSNQVIDPSLASGRVDAIAAKSFRPSVISGIRSPVNWCIQPESINQTTGQQVPELPVAPQGSGITHWHPFSTSTPNSDRGGLEYHNQQLQFAIPQNNHPTSDSFMSSAILNAGMDGSAATSNQVGDPSLASGHLRLGIPVGSVITGIPVWVCTT